MKLIITLALLALASTVYGDSAGLYGNGWSTPRVNVETRIQAPYNQLQVRYTHEGESSGWRNASEDPDGDGFDVDDSPETDAGGGSFRFDNGKAQYKNASGGWVDLGRKRKRMAQVGAQYVSAGVPLPCDGRVRPVLVPGAPWIEATAGSARLYDVYFLPTGDDVTTLPDDPTGGM